MAERCVIASNSAEDRRKRQVKRFWNAMDYRDAIEYLYSVRLFGTKLGLSNTRHLLRELGNPQEKFLTVHVAGTNGKGSVCALLTSILSAAGYSAGMFTSPHILSFRERIRICKDMISQEAVCHHLRKLLPTIANMAENPALSHPTYFEIVTSLAVDYFAENAVDVAVVETGMGGRLDATNVLPSKIEVITPIGLEHTAYLGHSLAEIAFEKAGIIKEGASVIVGVRDSEPLSVICRVASEKKATVLRIGEDIAVRKRKRTFPAQRLDIVTRKNVYPDIVLPLLGEHQAENCCLAIAAAEALQSLGFAIPRENIYQGIRRTRWPGRLELIPGQPNIILDAACNPQAWQALGKALLEIVKKAELTLVAGVLEGKDAVKLCEILFPSSDRVVLTQPASQRALPVEELRRIAASVSPARDLYCFKTVDSAISHASRLSSRKGSFVCITGSNYLLGPARKALGLDDLPDDFVLSEAFRTGNEKAPDAP